MYFKIENSMENRPKLIGVYEDREYTKTHLVALRKSGVFSGKKGEIFCYTTFEEELVHSIFVGLGKYEQLTSHEVKCAFAKGARQMKALKVKAFEVEMSEGMSQDKPQIIEDMIEGIRLGTYQFDKYKEDSKEYQPEVSLTHVEEERREEVANIIKKVNYLIDSILVARDWVNEPSNILYPETLAKRVMALGSESGFEVEVLDKEEVYELGMEAFLTVGQSSRKEPKLIIMRYFGDKENSETIGLVGKGITCDTGGYCLKPSGSMLGIKGDMAGAAAVVGAINTAANNKIKANVVGVIASCENKVTDLSYVPGDIIRSMAGKSIEIINTDAEGRLTLADAITYIIREEKVTKVIDIATLTGAVVGALGFMTTGALTNSDEFYEDFEKAFEKSAEKFWKFPIHEEHREMIKSKVADLKNSGGNHSGTITAGLFIEAFAENIPWIHLDIAGTAWTDSPSYDYLAAGATGAGVKTLYYLLDGMSK